VLLLASLRVGVADPGAQRLRHPPLANRARPGALGVLVGLLLAVGQPVGQPGACVPQLIGVPGTHLG